MDILETLRNIDISVFRFINADLKMPLLDTIMPWISDMGSGTALFLLGLFFMLFNREMKALGFLSLAGLTLSYYVNAAIKEMVGRPRPFLVLPDVNLLHTTGEFSFPSGHAMMVFTIAFIVSSYFRKARVIVYAFAALVCVSRMYQGVHYPSDVLGGAIFGILLGKLLVLVSERAEFQRNV